MSRDQFGLWGATLADEDFAQAVAALGILGEPARGDAKVLASIIDSLISGAPRVPFSIGRNFEAVTSPEKSNIAPADVFRDAWKLSVAPSQHLRLEIHQDSTKVALDPLWLVELLGRPTVAAGIYFLRDEPRVPVGWNWPLRIGLLDDPRSSDLLKAIQKSKFKQLFKVIPVDRIHQECDLLILPYSLRSSLELILNRSRRLSADCVLVLGAAKVAAQRAVSLLNTLRTEVECAAVAVASVPKPLRAVWFDSIIIELSHNQPLDVALLSAAHTHSCRAPVLMASQRFIDVAQLSVFAERLGANLGLIADRKRKVTFARNTAASLRLQTDRMDLASAGKTLRKNARDFHYFHEGEDATALANFRGEVERELGHPVHLAMANGGGDEPAPDEGRDSRTVQAEFLDPKTNQTADLLRPNAEYQLNILIDEPSKERISATRGIPRLPPSETGHELRIILTELRDGNRDALTRPQQADIHLPAGGPSTVARFAIRTAAKGKFIARIIVLHRTRVLQTLLLNVALHKKLEGAQLEEETMVREGFAGLENRQVFDAALILNENNRRRGIGTATRKSYTFFEPKGLEQRVDKMKKLLSSMVDLEPKDLSLKKTKVLKIVRTLAADGKKVWDTLVRDVPEELATASKIQVVETRAGDFLPVEFFYSQVGPLPDAKLCPHALTSLGKPDPDKCPNENNPAFVCPAAFWGFQKVIERRSHAKVKDGVYELSQPSTKRPQIEILNSVLIGWSNNVNKTDIIGNSGVVKTLKTVLKKQPGTAVGWKAWKKAIQKESPALLILLPHSQEQKEEEGDSTALEIGKELLWSENLEKDYICGPNRAPGPAVFLIGCNTALSPVAFDNFVERFVVHGASLVLGTLASIRGRHAASFVSRFTAALQKRAGLGTTFGAVLLEVKRQVLSEGDPFALTLIAYGDADWRL